MPNCFTLTRKSDPAAGPVDLVTIDEEMCQHFNKPVDSERWLHDWYDLIGFGLACGKDWAGLHEVFKGSPELVEIIDWLEANFITDAWAEIGRR